MCLTWDDNIQNLVSIVVKVQFSSSLLRYTLGEKNPSIDARPLKG